MAFGWSQRTCMQKFALVVAIVAFVVMLICLISNIVTLAQAVNQTWYTRCSDCGEKECVKCCQTCTRKDALMFYFMRGFSMLFCALGMMAEVYVFKFFRKLFMIFKYAWGRGLLQIFVGFLTLTGNLFAPGDEDAAAIAAGFGWVAIACGVVHLFLSCLCFKEYSEVGDDMRAARDEPAAGASARVGGAAGGQNQPPPSTAGPPPQQQPGAQPKYAL